MTVIVVPWDQHKPACDKSAGLSLMNTDRRKLSTGNTPRKLSLSPSFSLCLSDLSHWYMNIAPVLMLRHFHWIFNLATECSGQWLACSQSRDDLWYCNVLLLVFFSPCFLAGSPDRIAGADTDLPDREIKAGKGEFVSEGECKFMNTTGLLTT